ncbi:hypothetical protein HJC99_02195 [Candidatus Saccharibacteria bacterium]|nr:hypothetical protein [Candidatus Saccharibacteria bacterium]
MDRVRDPSTARRVETSEVMYGPDTEAAIRGSYAASDEAARAAKAEAVRAEINAKAKQQIDWREAAYQAAGWRPKKSTKLVPNADAPTSMAEQRVPTHEEYLALVEKHQLGMGRDTSVVDTPELPEQ